MVTMTSFSLPVSENVTCSYHQYAATGSTKTFHDYATDVFLSYITSLLQHVTRLDIFWDKYVPESLKADTRSKRRKGVRRHVESSSTLPGNWQVFLHIDENRTELFSFLVMRAVGIDTTKQVLTLTMLMCSVQISKMSRV